MSRFNTTSTPARNLAGGKAYAVSKEYELLSILLTSFVKDDFYRKEPQTLERLKELIAANGTDFTSKALVYARRLHGLRSITHVGTAELAIRSGKGAGHATDEFYNAVVGRVDDMLEILAYYSQTQEKLPSALKRGFRAAFNRFDGYQLAKYRGQAGAKWRLVDLVNMVRPKPTDKNKDALAKLIKDELASTDTWEAKLSAGGNKAQAWGELISTRRLGYFALLRNLRNIIKDAPEALPEALSMLVDAKLIHKSLVMPFRYTTAYDEIMASNLDSNRVRQVLEAISYATETALDNVPVFDGQTCVVVDVSGSMAGKPEKIARLLAAVLVKRNRCNLMLFNNYARYVQYNPQDSLMTIAKTFHFTVGGTNFNSIFNQLNRAYDRIIILSDMQGWMPDTYGWGRDGGAPTAAHAEYRKRYDCSPHIYSIDLKGYGTLQFPENNVYALAGFSEKIFDVMKFLEADRQALVNTVKRLSYKDGIVAGFESMAFAAEYKETEISINQEDENIPL